MSSILPGCSRHFAHDALLGHVEDADFRGHDHVILVGDHEAGRTQTVAVERRADLAPVGEGDRRRTVPRLHQGGVVFVEGLARRVHQRIAGPGFRDQHHHRVGERVAAGDQQLQGVVERGGVGLAVRNERPHLVEVGAQQVGLQRAPPGVHPVHIAAHGVDLAVVGDEPIGVGELPGREGVGREALVDQGESRFRHRVAKVLVEGSDLVREQQALVDDRPAGERGHVEVGERRRSVLPRQLFERVLGLLADRQDLALEGVLVRRARAARDDRLTDHRHLVENGLPKAGGVDRDVAPADQALALDADEMLELADREVAGVLVGRQEAHGDRVVARGRQIDARARRPMSHQRIGNLDQAARPVADQRIGADGAAMVEIHQDLEPAGDHFLRLSALDVGHEADAARVVLAPRVIQTLWWRETGQNLPLDTLIDACFRNRLSRIAFTLRIPTLSTGWFPRDGDT